MKKIILGLIAIVVLVLIGGVAYIQGGNHALARMAVTRATPDELAKAMSDDNFYGLWRESTLLVRGTVASITQQNGDTVVQFETSALFKTFCDIGTATTSAKSGDTLTVIAEGLQAKRLPDGVQLMGCEIVQ